MTKENKNLETKNIEAKTGILHSGIWASCLLALVAIIGGFWGAEGFRTIGIYIAFGFGLSIFGIVVVSCFN